MKTKPNCENHTQMRNSNLEYNILHDVKKKFLAHGVTYFSPATSDFWENQGFSVCRAAKFENQTQMQKRIPNPNFKSRIESFT